MKEKTREFVRIFGVVFMVMVAVPLVYRACVYFWPPAEKPRLTLTRFMQEDIVAGCVKLLAKPVADWSETEVKLEPEIYAWLKEQGNAILPWEWTDEARRKDPKGYAKCWLRIWEERKSHYENLFAYHKKEIERLEHDLEILATIHTHRTNQIARLRALASTNAFPCEVSLERIEKGWFWGWNKRVEMVECSDALAIIAATNSICSKETAEAQGESKRASAASDAISSSKEQLVLCEQLGAVCDKNKRQIEDGPPQDEVLKKSLVEILKR